mmetsp:Transcript_70962/g.201088  ORF Transcript_70962/g.201088 Transcript_70962/m.201088 type:complete len:235 (+) Transcript_70962:202-906(+)
MQGPRLSGCCRTSTCASSGPWPRAPAPWPTPMPWASRAGSSPWAWAHTTCSGRGSSTMCWGQAAGAGTRLSRWAAAWPQGHSAPGCWRRAACSAACSRQATGWPSSMPRRCWQLRASRRPGNWCRRSRHSSRCKSPPRCRRCSGSGTWRRVGPSPGRAARGPRQRLCAWMCCASGSTGTCRRRSCPGTSSRSSSWTPLTTGFSPATHRRFLPSGLAVPRPCCCSRSSADRCPAA